MLFTKEQIDNVMGRAAKAERKSRLHREIANWFRDELGDEARALPHAERADKKAAKAALLRNEGEWWIKQARIRL
jgi:ATP/maltotriose-dependent transcriptional regulator MalT